ncbi:Txe/YoeB family addiction module toxin [Pararhizobium arenae]|uniref:Txe/YoeB family addiction module toxin n=1 Tax=Pararhizobium arenae TaxID=1856850 RepID=UPI00094B5F2E|nr:Txe/YoeB family addiction module toxin [Pararhizobium arenae]
MKLVFSSIAWNQYQHWLEHDRTILLKINQLLAECLRTPFAGTGKPEPLRNELKGLWSRRITQEHRLVYRVTGRGDQQALEIAACRYYYE